MPLIQECHDSLPYIDRDIGAGERAAAEHEIEIEQELLRAGSASAPGALHPSIPDLPPPPRSEGLLAPEISRHATTATTATTKMVGGIDTSRYEALDPPPTRPPHDPGQCPAPPPPTDAYRTLIRQGAITAGHLESRVAHLALLDRFGKNAWLVANMQLEQVLARAEQELLATQAATEDVLRARKRAQVEHGQAECEALQLAWRTGVGRVLETEAAAEGLRSEIWARRMEMAARR
ncbi:MAG: hypothetical protein M1826_002542 [Phylliscum demangeonii]|nr:MAG: hypothetical protein M1826_002542 [Phylliscum demangeonii]